MVRTNMTDVFGHNTEEFPKKHEPGLWHHCTLKGEPNYPETECTGLNCGNYTECNKDSKPIKQSYELVQRNWQFKNVPIEKPQPTEIDIVNLFPRSFGKSIVMKKFKLQITTLQTMLESTTNLLESQVNRHSDLVEEWTKQKEKIEGLEKLLEKTNLEEAYDAVIKFGDENVKLKEKLIAKDKMNKELINATADHTFKMNQLLNTKDNEIEMLRELEQRHNKLLLKEVNQSGIIRELKEEIVGLQPIYDLFTQTHCEKCAHPEECNGIMAECPSIKETN